MLPGWEIVFELSATMIYVFLLILLSLWARNDYGKKVLLILFIVGTLISIGVTIGLSLQITSPYYLLAYPIISVPISFYLGNLVFLVIYTKVEKSRPSS
jgi:peptidoglycan/LPS O-acetylase OafA/YrhL